MILKADGSQLSSLFSKIMALLVALSVLFAGAESRLKEAKVMKFNVDASSAGEVLGNKVSNLNQWSADSLQGRLVNSDGYDTSEFIEYIQIMQATGGNAQRDLFVDPNNREVLDDYDFTKLITACRNILNFGAKPHIKTGNVPMKYSRNCTEGVFSVNVFPPDDYDVYYNYIKAIGEALVAEFGRDEVLSWRFGVYTEYENPDWFYSEGKDPAMSLEAFCKIYDYTVAALQSSIGENIFIGAHSMTVAQGLWDERDFIDHVAKGVNFKTGEVGTRICFLAASFYDTAPGNFNDTMTMPQAIDILRDKAQSVGLNDLIYGIDEGRILIGTKGANSYDLNMRACGYTYQAAYDARLIKQMCDNDIDYFSSWGYLTNGAFSGLPSVSYHVAQQYSKMAGMKRLPVDSEGKYKQSYDSSGFAEKDIAAIAAATDDGDMIRVMAYNFKNDLEYDTDVESRIIINAPQFADGAVTVTSYVIDDDANFFDEWVRDRKAHNITDDCFSWSPDDYAVETDATLNTPWAKELYFNELRPIYAEAAKLKPVTETVEVVNGELTIDTVLKANTVVFFEISD